LIEIAICLAVIGFALVAIIGILPMGMQVQKDNRQETIVNQDQTILLDAIRNGSQHLDDLTNYVYALTNYYSIYGIAPGAPPTGSGAVGFTYTNSSFTPEFPVTVPITNGNIIRGLLSQPKYVDRGTTPPSYRSNFIVAYVRAMSGAASEKAPQTNLDIQAGSFSYRMAVDLVPYSDFDRMWTNYTDPALYTPNTNALEIAKRFNYYMIATNYQNNLYDLRLTFRWPLNPQGTPGAGKQVYRTLVSGQLIPTNEPPGVPGLITTYWLQPRTYGMAK